MLKYFLEAFAHDPLPEEANNKAAIIEASLKESYLEPHPTFRGGIACYFEQKTNPSIGTCFDLIFFFTFT